VLGGLAGDVDSHDYHMGDAYEGFFSGSIIIDGKLFYNRFNAIGGNNVDNYVVAVDLHTGETLWERALTTPDGQRVDLDNGWLMYWDSFDVHGVFAYLVAETGSVWNMFDPTDGRWLFTMTDIPGGSTVRRTLKIPS
jgi:outer membrane protein assembly factor BamB